MDAGRTVLTLRAAEVVGLDEGVDLDDDAVVARMDEVREGFGVEGRSWG